MSFWLWCVSVRAGFIRVFLIVDMDMDMDMDI